jgi:predicted MPP superfamily phosphohydrolase
MKKKLIELAWDTWCLGSIVGIWPRFIEPKLLKSSSFSVFGGFPDLRVVQFSDLHLSKRTSDRFLAKLANRINESNADLLLFTGDFICYSSSEELYRLEKFLGSLRSKLGSFCILGNHDYSQYVSLNELGEMTTEVESGSTSLKGLKMLFTGRPKPIPIYDKPIKRIALHTGLVEVLKKTNFNLLHNHCIQIGGINLVGLGDLWAGQCDPESAFSGYDESLPGIVMSHNPDSLDQLEKYPGTLILSGHTHGTQVNLPLIRKQFIAQKYATYQRGWIKDQGKTMYINRGVGAVIPFRWFSTPELTTFNLRGENERRSNSSCGGCRNSNGCCGP